MHLTHLRPVVEDKGALFAHEVQTGLHLNATVIGELDRIRQHVADDLRNVLLAPNTSECIFILSTQKE